jgi:hypothetical protein
MSTGNGRPLGRPPHKHSKTAVAQPGDEQFTWSRKRLEKMDARFTRRLEWAFQWGHEHRASAFHQVELPVTSAPHFSTPICPDAWAGLLRSSIPSPVPK